MLTVIALIALPEEHEVFLTVFPFKADVSVGRHVCLEHDCNNENVRLISVLAEQMGSQNAGNSAQVAITNFGPDLVIVIGIAGSLISDARIGDVCVSNEVIDVLQNTKVSGNLEISLAPDFYQVNADLIASFAFLRVHPVLKNTYNEWRLGAKRVGLKGEEESLDEAVKLHIGPIACGPVSASQKFKDKLRGVHRKFLALETESGGVFNYLRDTHVAAVAIRGICDSADETKTAMEHQTKGLARSFGMYNAASLLRFQLSNHRFLDVGEAHLEDTRREVSLFPNGRKRERTVVAELDICIRGRLQELSYDFRHRPDSFYLPVPRARQLNYLQGLEHEELGEPEGILDCLRHSDKVMIRLPRSYPSHALGWTLAHSFLREQIDNRVLLPIVVSGAMINPPSAGLKAAAPERIRSALESPEYLPLYIIEEPPFSSRHRLKFLTEEIGKCGGKYLVLTRSEDRVASVDDFSRFNGFIDYVIAPISFSETAFFLERAFSMSAPEAEKVAIKLDDTFRRFRLDAHPTYFAGLQEETLAALINANKRAELIQLAVDGLLSLVVAADRSVPALSRTTRERYLSLVVVETSTTGEPLTESRLVDLAEQFLAEYKFDQSTTEFLSPFFKLGILFRSGEEIVFSHPYVRSYLLANALRSRQTDAINYFNPENVAFDFFSFDLYCELGSHDVVVDKLIEWARTAFSEAHASYPAQHIYLERGRSLAKLTTVPQLGQVSQRLVKVADRLERSTGDENVRAEKQRILDARKQARSEVDNRGADVADGLPIDVRREFDILDGLARATSLTSIAVGSGAEALKGNTKLELGHLLLDLTAKFSDVWTRNRARIDFDAIRSDLLSDANIASIAGADATKQRLDKVKVDFESFINVLELNTMLEPLGRVLWGTSQTASVRVLTPIINELTAKGPIEEIMRSCWLMDVDPERGRKSLKASFESYSGSDLIRLVVANHLVWRAYWHHYKTRAAGDFLSGARSALAPIGLQPPKNDFVKPERKAHKPRRPKGPARSGNPAKARQRRAPGRDTSSTD